jgi:manganese-dependent inorganic pyrophosphatase
MEETIATTGLQMLFFMMTDIVKESSYLIYMGNGAKELIESSFNVTPNYGMFVLKGVVSRKKQLIPAIMADLQQ